MNTSSTATAETFEAGSDGSFSRKQHGCCSGTNKRKWSAVELATMIGGFIVFWPVGLVALGVKLVKGEMWPGASESVSPWTAYRNWREKTGGQSFTGAFNSHSPVWGGYGATGNAAFDAYKKEQLDRLEAERRKLEDEQKAFADYLVKLRKAKDQDEFDRFMAERNPPKPAEG
jgi:hypothetical protein